MTDQYIHLYAKIAAVAGSVEAAEKDGRNKQQGYRYATLASILAVVKPALAAQQLAIVPHLVGFEEIATGTASSSGAPFTINRVSMHYHVVDGQTGESVIVPWQAQSGTYGDDKGLAKAQTIALRTFLVNLFQIPTEDEDDVQENTAQRPQPKPAQRPQPKPAQQRANGQAENNPRADIKARIYRLMNRVGELGGVLNFDPLIDFDELDEDGLKAIGEGLRMQVNELKAAQEVKPEPEKIDRGVMVEDLPL